LEPVEINAGQWYLRGLRADSRVDDRPALAELGVTDPDHVARSAAQWSADTSYLWAVCEVTTGELLAEVTRRPERSPPERAPATPGRQPRPLSPSGDSPPQLLCRRMIRDNTVRRTALNRVSEKHSQVVVVVGAVWPE